jgi:RimJ/RimL family protein N-acetyltransferase
MNAKFKSRTREGRLLPLDTFRYSSGARCYPIDPEQQQENPTTMNDTAAAERPIIRQVTIDDLDAYRDLRLEGLRDHPEAFGSDYATSLAQPREWWQGRVAPKGDGGTIQVADDGGELVGTAGLLRGDSPKQRHGAVLVGVYVRPAWRGTGLAGALIESCLAWGRERGVRKVTLGVAVVNTPAIRRYTNCGFTVYGVEPEVIVHEGVAYDELLMVRMIGNAKF